ncbi:MAG: hypothetical protein ACOZCP_01260 [Pseudomonadota bacterium]
MTENVENLILEHLKKIQADIALVKTHQKETVLRLGRIEMAIAGLRRDAAHTEEGLAEHSLRFDHLEERIERIEQRLALRDQ